MNAKNPVHIIALTVVLSLCTTYASADSRPDLKDITSAAYTGDTDVLHALAQASEGYHRAYALYRQAQLGFVEPGEHLKPVLEQAAAILQPRQDAESKVLLAAVYNLSMGLEPSRAKQLAPKALELLAEAKASPFARPRALLIEGINRFYTPASYGGGADVALALLEEAAVLFTDATTAAGEENINWGEAETQLWLGQVHAALGQPDQARSHYEHALALDPACQWAQHYLNNF